MPTYKHCLEVKTTRKSFGKVKRIYFSLQLVSLYIYIYGSMNVKVHFGAYYFIKFINNYTQFVHIYLISHKPEALNCFQTYGSLVENQLDERIKVLKIDQRCEYLSKQFKRLYNEKAIDSQLTILRTPQQMEL